MNSKFLKKISRKSYYYFRKFNIVIFRSSGVSAFEVRGEKNGVFMKHLLQHIADEASVLEMLTKTFQGNFY